MNKKNKKIIFKIGIMIIFILLLITPIAIGYFEKTTIIQLNKPTNEHYYSYSYDIYDLPEYIAQERFPFLYYQKDNFKTKKEAEEYSNNNYRTTLNKIITENQIQPLDGLMNSSWPMHGHDIHHMGRSAYSTVDTWDKIWDFETYGWAKGGPTIDKDGIIYIGAYSLYAVYSNGTMKWKYDTIFSIESIPAIDENGIIYFGVIYGEPNYLYAVYPNGTLKWKYSTGELASIFSSPAIGDDGTIYFGSGGGNPPTGCIRALNPDGTLKWRYDTNHVVYSSPAIGLDGTIYCGSHDCNVYALYPNNGTLKWKFTTGNWVHGSPTIADDGIVYIGSDNGYLYAFYPVNGTVKWAINIGAIYGSLALDKDGTIYTGVWEKKFYAIYPNGTIKWSFNTGSGKVWGSSPALSDDGTLYFGTCDLEWTGGVEIIALYTDGTVKWRKSLDTVFSSPAISSDGTVYIGSCGESGVGFLNAFGVGVLEIYANGPYYGLINEPMQFTGSSSGGYSPHSYHWDFGDTHTSEEQNPIHTYTNAGNYTVTLTVTDNTSNTSSDTTWTWIQTTNTAPSIPIINGSTKCVPGKSYNYSFLSADPDETPIWYYIDWGDGTSIGWIGPYNSGEQIIKSHIWPRKSTYTILCKAKDPYNAESDWGTLEVTTPRNKIATNTLFLRFLELFPLLERLLRIQPHSSF